MKIFFSSLLCLFFILGCNPNAGNESITGSSSDTEIKNLSITVDTLYIQGSPAALVVSGAVKNLGTTATTPPWYIEAEFYTDSTYSVKLGGNNTQITSSIKPGESTFWTVRYSSSNTNILEFPNFRVSNIRGIYKR